MKFCYDCANTVDEGINFCPFCGGDLSNDKPKEIYHLAPGSTLKNERYLLGRAIGYGGFGITYAAYDNLLRRRVAIKEYFPVGYATRNLTESQVSIFSGEKSEQYDKGRSRFLLEARNMAMFGNEPDIVNVIDFFEENNTAYIIMEYLDGTDLRHYIKNAGGKLPYEDAIRIVKPVCEALTKIHREGIIHRDISPDNIFMTKSGAVKLIDFGAARLALGDKEKTLSVILKPGFAPPEQYKRHSIQGVFTDIYALGATFYNMITGIMPDDSIERVMDDALQPPSAAVGAGIPENVDKAVMRAMAIDYRERFGTAEEFFKALDPKNAYTSAFVPIPAFFVKSKEQKTVESITETKNEQKTEKSTAETEKEQKAASDTGITVFLGINRNESADDAATSVPEEKEASADDTAVPVSVPERKKVCADDATVFIPDEPVISAKPVETGKTPEMKYAENKTPVDMPSAWSNENPENEEKQKKSRSFPLWAKLTAAGLAVCMLFGILMISGVINVKPASNPSVETPKPTERFAGNITPNPTSAPTAKPTSKPTTAPTPTPTPEPVPVVFHNANFEAAFRKRYNITGTITMDMILGYMELDLSQSNPALKDITDVAMFKNLTWLNLEQNQIVDISPLAQLTKLENLYLLSNSIRDINPLAKLTNLKVLDFYNNQISNITSLSGLKKLQYLCLWKNKVSDITPLSGLTNLEVLDLGGNKITDISTLYALVKLNELSLGGNTIKNLQPLSQLKNLTKLFLHNNHISKIDSLAGLTKLQHLVLWQNQISDLSPLSGLKNLTNLDIELNNISNISPLSGLTKMKELYLWSNSISDISPLGGLTDLTILEIFDNKLNASTDISPLYNLAKLKQLKIIEGNSLTQSQIDAIQSHLPNCEIK